MKKLPIYLSIYATVLALPASASFVLLFATDASGNPTTGSYTGGGTPDANITPGASSKQITGVGSGDIIVTEIGDGPQTALVETLTTTTTFDFGAGGTADVEFARSGATAYKGFNIFNLTGTSCLNFTTVFSAPIHGRSSTSRTDGFPWGFSTGLLSAGTGFDPADFDVTYTIDGVQYAPNGEQLDPNAYSSTLPSTFDPFVTGEANTTNNGSPSAWETVATSPGTPLVFNSSDGFGGLNGDGRGGAANSNLLVRGLDEEGTGIDGTDLSQFYADTFSVSIKPLDADGNPTTFASDSRFVFSFDGDRSIELDSLAVPEPSSAALLGLAGLALVARRRK